MDTSSIKGERKVTPNCIPELLTILGLKQLKYHALWGHSDLQSLQMYLTATFGCGIDINMELTSQSENKSKGCLEKMSLEYNIWVVYGMYL